MDYILFSLKVWCPTDSYYLLRLALTVKTQVTGSSPVGAASKVQITRPLIAPTSILLPHSAAGQYVRPHN